MWILIIVVMNMGVTTVTFHTQDACLKAQAALDNNLTMTSNLTLCVEDR